METQCVNPFVHKLRFRKIDYLKIFIGTIILLPIRVILTALLFILTSMIAKVSNHYLDKWKLEKEEETEWRNFFKKPCIYTLRVMFFIAGFHKIKVVDKGGPNDEKEARILVIAPHTSPFDIVCGLALNVPSVVSRHDAIDIPFFGNILKLTDPVFVQRDSQSSRQNVINGVLETIKYLRIVFFPEGTCSNRRALVQFKSGAFKPGLPVQPIALKYDQFGGPDTLSWTWDGPNAMISIWLTFCRWSTGFEVVKLPVYYPSQEEKLDADLYAKNVSKLLSYELKIPVLYYSYDDVKYLNYSVFRSPVCLKFLKLCDKIANQSNHMNGNIIMNGNSFHNKSENSELKHRTNGTIAPKIPKNKKQLFIDTTYKTIDITLEKIELNSPKDISSVDDLVSLFDLRNNPEITKSLTIRELFNCLKKVSNKANTTHLAVVLNLCDLRESSFWQRLRNSFHLLRHNVTNDDFKVISLNSLNDLLWLAFGIENMDKNIFKTEIITFDCMTNFLLKDCRICLEENAKQLLQEKYSSNLVQHN